MAFNVDVIWSIIANFVTPPIQNSYFKPAFYQEMALHHLPGLIDQPVRFKNCSIGLIGLIGFSKYIDVIINRNPCQRVYKMFQTILL